MAAPARGPRCALCDEPATNGRYGETGRCDACAGHHLSGRDALVHPTTRYDDDVAAQLCVAAFPDGMTLEQVGEALGLTRERVRQIEKHALRRIALKLRQLRSRAPAGALEIDALAARFGHAPGEGLSRLQAWHDSPSGHPRRGLVRRSPVRPSEQPAPPRPDPPPPGRTVAPAPQAVEPPPSAPSRRGGGPMYKPRRCAHCDSPFDPTGARQRYCDNDCRSAAAAQREQMCEDVAQDDGESPDEPIPADGARTNGAAIGERLNALFDGSQTGPYGPTLLLESAGYRVVHRQKVPRGELLIVEPSS